MFGRRKKTLESHVLKPGDAIRHYRIRDKLGEGGMGIVYAARDERLQRDVAIKTIRDESGDKTLRERLWREARSAARTTHPNVCHIYEIDEADGVLYVAMELLEGRPLSARLTEGPIPFREAMQITLEILAPLASLHRQGIVHRDLKPSNVFLTSHGVKLLDFGLARPLPNERDETELALTQPGAVIGTPRYMAPEQWARKPIGPRSDLFAIGALLFEMLTGNPAFNGATVAEIYHAVAHDHPPALTGGPEALAADRVIQRALCKRPEDRYPSADEMANDVRASMMAGESASPSDLKTTTRLIVLPFRMLRPDAEAEFLAHGLPDAIVASLSGIESLVVRSTATASQYAGADPDIRKIASEAGVDAVLLGTVLRAGENVRVTTQLIEAPSGTVMTSKAVQGSMSDVFKLQDDLAREIVDSLVATADRDAALAHSDRPASAKAYEYYLRANQLSYDRRLFPKARDLYRACLEEDPHFAPAWARLGRVYRVMAKYGQEGDHRENFRLAEEAFKRALEINPDNSTTHSLYTYLEVESMGRARDSMIRLLERARHRKTDPHLFTGLVLACRFCGLLDASVAADRRARRLDPGVRSSVQYTYWMMGDYENAIRYDDEDIRYVRSYSLSMIGREAEAANLWRELAQGSHVGVVREFGVSALAAIEGDKEVVHRSISVIFNSGFTDPEGIYFLARLLARTGVTDLAIETLERVVNAGFSCHSTMLSDPWLDAIRSDKRFANAMAIASQSRREAIHAFRQNGGPQLLGVHAD